jgi:hypothetical protein
MQKATIQPIKENAQLPEIRMRKEATWSAAAGIILFWAIEALLKLLPSAGQNLWTSMVFASCVASVLSCFSVYRSAVLWKLKRLKLSLLNLRIAFALGNAVLLIVLLIHS